MKIAMGCAAVAFPLKEAVKSHLQELGHEVLDFSPVREEISAKYPLAAIQPSEALQTKKADFAILLCGSGMGMSLTSNSYPGVRAAVVESAYAARAARAINNANALCLGCFILGERMALNIVDTFLDTEFPSWPGSNPERLQGSVDCLNEIKEKASKIGD